MHTMHCYLVVEPRASRPHSTEDERVFQDANTMLRGAIIGVLGDSVVDTYVTMSTGKEMWDTL